MLQTLADELLSDQADDTRLQVATTELYSLCSSLTGINHTDDSEAVVLESGEAISPENAAGCVLDYTRTSKFLRGLYAAILEARKRFPDVPIEILYAGCGPFAPLAIPLTTRFNSGEIKFTLLDVNQRSLDAARSIFEAVGKSAFVRDYIRRDAASFKNEAPHPIHIVVVEAMQAALEREPQVAITMNLAPQLCRGGIFIPEKITIDCFLSDPTKESPAISLGRVLDLTAENCRSLLAGRKRFNIPDSIDGECYLTLMTAITIYDSIALNDQESGLTCPRILFAAGKVQSGKAIEFEYHRGQQPGFKYRLREQE